MKKKMFDYLEDHYNINVSQLLISGVKNGSVGMIDARDPSGELLPLVYTTQKDEEETDFYLFCVGDKTGQEKIQGFINGLKSFIGENSGKSIVKSSYDKDWYYFEDEELKISFGVKSEKSGFSMRLSFPNNQLKYNPIIAKKAT